MNYFKGSVNVQTIEESITFSCPGCKAVFKFDPVGEYELVLCPICETECMTIKKGQNLLLEHFEFNLVESAPVLR
jgi:Zn finger protein HypA/HybF involved in hydrogenase expression